MNNFEILSNYSKGDLRRLAKGKISEIVGLDADKVLRDLSRVLGNYESIKHNIEFRMPPTDTILEVLLDAPDHQVKVDDLKPAVKRRIESYVEASKAIDFRDTAKGYRLYSRLLTAAWEFGTDFDESEANLLRVLRHELGITRKDHQLIMAHPEVDRLHFDSAEYEDSLEFVTREGIVLVCCGSPDSFYVLSDETAGSLLQLWGFELKQAQYDRLLARLSKPQLSRALKSAGLRTTGSNAELAARLGEKEISPSRILSGMPGDELATLLVRLGLTRGGNKEDRVLRILDYFESDSDIAKQEATQPVAEIVPDEEVLREETVADLLEQLGTEQLAGLLGSLSLQKSGSKTVKIDRLIQSPYGSERFLSLLSLDDLRDFSAKLGLRKSGNKSDLMAGILAYYLEQSVNESSLPAKDLLDFYEEIGRQDKRAYPADATPAGLTATRMGLDFERATRYIFKNMLRLDTKTQTAGREDPDGTITDDDGFFYCYECKTVLNPPYTLPIQHRLQLRNYITAITSSRRADRFGGYLIIAHSFNDGIDTKLAEIQAPSDVPIAVIEARDLLAFARKWHEEHSLDTYPIGRALKNGRVTARDLQRAAFG